MKTGVAFLVGAAFMVLSHVANPNQADNTTIRIDGYTSGPTPFISNLHLTASDTSVLKSIEFLIVPKQGAVTRPLSATYANEYLIGRGYENQATGEITLPVYGLYDGYTNTAKLTYRFLDGSSKQANISITTAAYHDPCGYKNPIVLQRRTNDRSLSYDYMMIKGGCSDFAPAIIDTDGALRWVGDAGVSQGSAIFFDNAAYLGHGRKLTRVDLDGTVTELADYSNLGVVGFNHNIDRGKNGMILQADTTTDYNAVDIEVDAAGRVLKIWNMADIIRAAMRAGGDDPSQFVFSSPTDWWHGNSATYNRADDSVIISSRENFLICLDYETNAIKWILGDPTKAWYQYPSLRRFALTLAPGTLPPIGQHAISVTFDQNIMVLDNGAKSFLHQPTGDQREYASPRKYSLDLVTRTATEVWNFTNHQSIHSPFCSTVYEDAPYNYLVNYSIVNGGIPGVPVFAQIQGLNAAGDSMFSYRYPATNCGTSYRATIVHLENTKFPTVGPQPLNLSTRGVVASGDDVLIGGFVITGNEAKTIVLRALGPSLRSFGVPDVLSDPVLNLYNASRTLIATNDNWQSDPHNADIQKNGFAPANLLESATLQTLPPGAYTVIVKGNGPSLGTGLVELYDLSPKSHSKLTNISTRGSVGTGDNVLIGGFIVGDVESATVIVRALGPSLSSFGIGHPLSDPVLTIYDSKGSVIASNNNWQDDTNAILVQRNRLAPPNASESALVLHLPAGAYTAVVSGAGRVTGTALVEVYDLD